MHQPKKDVRRGRRDDHVPLVHGIHILGGRFSGTINNTTNGPEWHLFTPDSANCWWWPSAVYLEPLNSGANPDLYVRKDVHPRLNSYDCRPYLGSGQTESCIVDLAEILFSVRNRSTTQAAPYRLTITTPIVVI